MKYNVEKIIETGPWKNYVFFWGHQPAKNGTITKTCFSQWWIAPFVADGIAYKTAEHWMMAKKALLFNDQEILDTILKADTADEAKKLGRAIKNYDDTVWLSNRYQIVQQGNYHKFSQHKGLKEFLLGTGNDVLVEASPVDAIWGIGMAGDDKDAVHPEKWKGLNLLGFALMEVRDELKFIK